jgi:hypothetical protein
MRPTSRNAKEISWRTRFGAPEGFVFSGIYGAASASHVICESPDSRAGAYIIAFCFIQSATTGFTTKAFPCHNRVSPKETCEGLEPDDGKLSRPVLRGPCDL